MRRALLAGVLVLALTGCGSGAAPATGGPSEPELRITVDAGNGSGAETYTLDCDGEDGTHPDADRACGHLAGLEDPFAPLPADVVCTEQYGGPQTAHVTGTWDGEPVDLRLSRTDGCRIAQWDALGPLLPAG